MIALNELLENTSDFEQKYLLMGKSYNTIKINNLEKKFIELDKLCSENRAKCNKLCANIANLIEKNQDIKLEVKKINSLNKLASKQKKIADRAIKKINRKLKKMANPALGNNTQDISVKTMPNPNFSALNAIDLLKSSMNFSIVDQTYKQFITSNQNIVLRQENFPKLIKLQSKNNNQDYLIIDNNKIQDVYENITKILKDNAVSLTIKSIKSLNKHSKSETVAKFSNGSGAVVELIGEYVSRDVSFKFYDSKLDMTKFVQMIKISIF